MLVRYPKKRGGGRGAGGRGTDGRLRNRRLEKIREEQDQYRARQTARAKRGAAARWDKQPPEKKRKNAASIAQAMPQALLKQCPSNAPSPSPSPPPPPSSSPSPPPPPLQVPPGPGKNGGGGGRSGEERGRSEKATRDLQGGFWDAGQAWGRLGLERRAAGF